MTILMTFQTIEPSTILKCEYIAMSTASLWAGENESKPMDIITCQLKAAQNEKKLALIMTTIL